MGARPRQSASGLTPTSRGDPAVRRGAGRRDALEDLGDTMLRLAQHFSALTAAPGWGEAADDLRRAQRSAGDVLRKVRQLSAARDRELLRQDGLQRALQHVAEDCEIAAGATTRLNVSGDERLVAPDDAAVLLWGARLCAVELRRRSRAYGVVLTLAVADSEVALDVRDDGIGLAPRRRESWRYDDFEMATLSRAVADAGGSFRVTPCEPRGLSFRVVLPLRRDWRSARRMDERGR